MKFSLKKNELLKDTYRDLKSTMKDDQRNIIVDIQRQQLDEKKLIENLNNERNHAIDTIKQSIKLK